MFKLSGAARLLIVPTLERGNDRKNLGQARLYSSVCYFVNQCDIVFCDNVFWLYICIVFHWG
jgi:hypothetical protein